MNKKNFLHATLISTLFCTIYAASSNCGGTAAYSHRLARDLLQAIAERDEHKVVLLLIQGAPFDCHTDNTSPLMLAAHNGYTEITALLLAANANPNFQHQGGWTALAHAAYQGHLHIVSQLIDAGADIDKEVFTHHSFKGSIAEVYRKKQRLFLRSALRYRPRYFKATALHCAAQNGHNEVVRALLQSGANKEHQDHYQRTPLIVATQYEHTRTVQILIEAGAQLDTTDRELNAAIHYAALSEHGNMLQILTRAGACLNTVNKWDKTPLLLAVDALNNTAINTLLRHGAHLPDPPSLNTHQYLAIGLHASLHQKHAQKVSMFLEYIENKYNVPRDITRIICTMADLSPDEIPPAPCSTKALTEKNSLSGRMHSCTVL